MYPKCITPKSNFTGGNVFMPQQNHRQWTLFQLHLHESKTGDYIHWTFLLIVFEKVDSCISNVTISYYQRAYNNIEIHCPYLNATGAPFP